MIPSPSLFSCCLKTLAFAKKAKGEHLYRADALHWAGNCQSIRMAAAFPLITLGCAAFFLLSRLHASYEVSVDLDRWRGRGWRGHRGGGGSFGRTGRGFYGWGGTCGAF